MHQSFPKQFPLFILVSSVCKSLQCLISTLTQGGDGGLLFRLTCSVVLWGGRNTANNYHRRVLAVSGHTGFAPTDGVCAFPVYTAQAPGCSAGELSKAGPGLRAHPRSKPLRFRFSGTPQRCRLGWACVLCPSQVRAAQVTRYLASALSSGTVRLIASPVPAAWFPGCTAVTLPQVCLFWAADLWLQPSRRMSTVQNPRKSWLEAGSLLVVW